MAQELDGSGGKLEDQDEILRSVRRKTLRFTQVAAPRPPTPGPEKAAELPVQANPLADLPHWSWPFDAAEADRVETFASRVQPAEGVELDPEGLLNLLAWNISLTADEKDRILEASGRLSQSQFDQLLETLEEERRNFMALWPALNPEGTRIDLLGAYYRHAREWARLLLGNEDQALARLSGCLLDDDPRFARWTALRPIWALLARDLLAAGRTDQARTALERGAAQQGPLRGFADLFLDGLDPQKTQEETWRQGMQMLQQALGDTP